MSNTLNTTNTNLTVQATIIAGDATDGEAELLFGGVPFTPAIKDTTIAAGDTTVTFDFELLGNAAVQAKFPANGVFSVRLIDAAGNVSTSTVNPTLVVDYAKPAAPQISFTAITANLGSTANTADHINLALKNDFSNFKVNIANAAFGNEAGTLFIKLTDSVDNATSTSGEAIAAGAIAADRGVFIDGAIDSFDEGPITIEAWVVDAAGNESAPHAGVTKLNCLDITAPDMPTDLALYPVGGYVVANTLNTTNTSLIVMGTIVAGQATGGTAEVLKDGSSLLPPQVQSALASDLEFVTITAAKARYPESGVISIRLTDAAGNSSVSAVNPTLTVDYDIPAAPTSVTLTPVGGTIVANTLNTTNTNLTVQAIISAGEATDGKAELLLNGVAYASPVDTTIAAGDTTVTFDFGLANNAAVQSKFPTGGVISVRLRDSAGNPVVSSVGNPTLIVDYSAPVVSAPTNVAQTLKSGTTSTSTVQSTEAGNIYLVKHLEPATTQAEIDAAMAAHKAFLGKGSAAANTAYTVTPEIYVAPVLVDGVYDIVAVDNAGNVSAIVSGWLTVDNTPPVVSAPTNVAQTLKSGVTSTSTVQSNEAGRIYLVKNGEAAATTAQIQAAVDANKAFLGKDGAAANTAYTVTLTASLNDGVYDLVAVDIAGNVSAIVAGWLTVDNTAPVVSAPTNLSQRLKSGATSTSTVQSNETGRIYLVKSGEAAATTTQIQAAVDANKAFLGKDGATANTPYTVTLPAGLIDGVYDLVAVDVASNVSAIVGGWLTVDNTAPVVSAPTNVPQRLKSGATSTSTVQSNEAGRIYLVKNGEAAATTTQIQAAVDANKAFLGKDGATANTPYTVTLPVGLIDGVYDLVAVDVASNVSAIVAGWLTVDNTPPTVTINQKSDQGDPTNANFAEFTAEFSEPVTGFDAAADVDATGSTVGGTKTITITAVSTTIYTVRVTISGGVSDGIYKATVKASIAADSAGNLNQISTSTDNSVTRDTVAPDLSMTELVPLDNATGVGKSGVISMVFNEPVKLGTGQVRIRRNVTTSIYIDVPSANVVVNEGNPRIVNITYSGLSGNVGYNIRVDDTGVFYDLAGNTFATLTNNNTWNFTTAP